ncbi:hypothetical protein [Streptomyces sp. NPDC088360]|uniref:hypothetical protein n=1 Tax=Streptomyces sp. NPDC088360 TaxID=3154515 RepID=UPI00344B5EDD
MSHAQRPDPVQEMARRMAESIVNSPALEGLRRQSEEFAEAVQRYTQRTANRYAEQFVRTMAPAIAARNEQYAQAVAAFADQIRPQVAGYGEGFRLDVSRLNFDVLTIEPLSILPEDTRAGVARLLQETTDRLDAGELTADDVHDELLDTLAESARTFAAGQPAGLSWEAKKKLFLWFWGALVFLVLMQAQVESETVKELMEDAGGALLLVPPAVASAAVVWDKIQPDPDPDPDPDPGPDIEDGNDGAV